MSETSSFVSRGDRRKSNSLSQDYDSSFEQLISETDEIVDKVNKINFRVGENESSAHTPRQRSTKAVRNRRTRSLYGVSPNCKFGPKGGIQDNSATTLTIPDPGNQKLIWSKAPLTVLVIKKMFDESALSAFKQLVCWLIEVKHMVVYVEYHVTEDRILATDPQFIEIKSKLKTFAEGKDDLTGKIDFIICLGGDGTLLYASSLFQSSVPPVMAFNLGSLGFLTPFIFANYKETVSQVLDGNAGLLLRYRLKCVLCKKDSVCENVSSFKNIDKDCSKKIVLILNEIVVDRGHSPFLSNVDLYVDGKLVTSVQGDGLIVSTPTGSTAYAVAAGASMVHPSVPAIMITPICPHSLSFRPIVVPAGVEIKICVSPEARHSAWVSLDGRNRQEIFQGDSVLVTMAQYPVPSICAKDQIDDWFDSLAECLHWNVRKPQKPISSSVSTTSMASLDSLDQLDVSS